MALRNLRYDGDELLRKRSKPVTEITKKIQLLAEDMRDTMAYYNGVGIAAPQVGILKRMIVIDNEEEIYDMINPEIISTEGTQSTDEGCLSIPGMIGYVRRPEKLKVRYQDINGKQSVLEADEKMAVIISHEIDHLDGILYKDRAEAGTFRENKEEEEEKVKGKSKGKARRI